MNRKGRTKTKQRSRPHVPPPTQASVPIENCADKEQSNTPPAKASVLEKIGEKHQHVNSWSTFGALIVAIVLGVLNRIDLSENKRDFEAQKKLFDEKMTVLGSAFEKARKLEISPHLECEASHEPVELAKDDANKFAEFRLKNIGRGHAYKADIDVIITDCLAVPVPKVNEELNKTPDTSEIHGRTSARILEDKTITSGSSIDHLHVRMDSQSIDGITGIGGHIRMEYADVDGNENIGSSGE